MRKLLVVAWMVTLVLVGLPNAQAVEQGQGRYKGTMGAGVVGVTDLGFILCTLRYYVDPTLGCIGGDIVYSPSGAIYHRIQTFIVDTVSASNVYGWSCLKETDDTSLCLHGTDPIVAGCGVALDVDSTGFHEGGRQVWTIVHTLQLDPATTGVCTGTLGDITVLFIE